MRAGSAATAALWTLAIALRLHNALAFPIDGTSDARAGHLFYIRYVRTHWRQPPVKPHWETWQPPLFYWSMAGLWALTSPLSPRPDDIGRPRATFGGQDLYPSVFEKAAALLESLCQNHPFVDGNKRVAYAAAGPFPQQNGWTLDAETDNAVAFMIEVASGRHRKDEIRIWIENHAVPYARVR